jgi:hypothetical protein
LAELIQPEGSESDSRNSEWKSFTLHNSKLSRIAEDIQSTGLASLADVDLLIIPPLSAMNKLPQPNAIIQLAHTRATKFREIGKWKQAADAYLWLFEQMSAFPRWHSLRIKATALLIDYLRTIDDAIWMKKRLNFPEEGVRGMEQLMSDIGVQLQKGTDSTVLGCILYLYKEQGRPWTHAPEWLREHNVDRYKVRPESLGMLQFSSGHNDARHDTWYGQSGFFFFFLNRFGGHY